MSSIVIIGNGVAANQALRAIRKRDHSVRVVMVSEEPEPAYSACVLSGYLSGKLSRDQTFIRSMEDYRMCGAELISGRRARAIDPERQVVAVDDEALPYERLILATGSQPVLPNIPETTLAGNFTFKTLADTDAILNFPAERYVVVGAGPIGVEASLALRRRGRQVVLVEQLGWVLPKVFNPGPASRIEEALNALGVQIRLGTRVSAVLGKERVTGVMLGQEALACDAVIWAVGVRPRVELASGAELKLGPSGGIQTDVHMRTSQPSIFACGDCIETVDVATGRPGLNMLWHSASFQGAVAGGSCLGYPGYYSGATVQVVLGLENLHAGAVGTNAAGLGDEAEVQEQRGRHESHHLVFAGGRLVGAQSIGNLRYLGAFQAAILQGSHPGRWERMVENGLTSRKPAPWMTAILPFLKGRGK